MGEREKTPHFVVIPEFRVEPDVMAAFLEAAMDDAKRSLADEPGCQQFDVVCPEDKDNVVLFYEVYDDRDAFEVHLQTPHLKRFQAAMQSLGVEESQVRFAAREPL
ncbi:putative quinol monooxygenase [Aminobacter aminovorans]|uniref:putative quinol monooxygenase n=1 Tax=Aminobacter TaxID=31988 RepID=UPI00285BD56F|nr:putative quinol monooxygenase [Aminobacter aminovorans]MDR7222318.1 quinol monooxygenase YgiN [Aminobacter aminovorans]